MPAPNALPPPAANEARRPETPKVSDELAAAVAAATADMPGGYTAAPFITFMQRDAAARELRQAKRRRWLRLGLAAAAALVVLHFAVTRFFYQAPSDAALHRYATTLGRAVEPLHSTPRQPFHAAGVTVTLTDRVSSNRIRYAAEITLQLTQSLYVPAISNGTAAYRQMQQSLWTAHEQEIKLKLFEGGEGPAAPELPLLIAVSHRAGEKLVVRVPFEAKRFGWTWRIDPAQLALRFSNTVFDGTTVEHYAATPHLVFGAPGTLADIRRRTQLARTYILAVAKEVQKQANAEAVTAVAPPDPVWANLPALDLASAAMGNLADQPALPETATAPAVNPDAPAIDPNQPAVRPELRGDASERPEGAPPPLNRGAP